MPRRRTRRRAPFTVANLGNEMIWNLQEINANARACLARR
jgi:hypothetical protein